MTYTKGVDNMIGASLKLGGFQLPVCCAPFPDASGVVWSQTWPAQFLTCSRSQDSSWRLLLHLVQP